MKKISLTLLTILLLSSCAQGLNQYQRVEYNKWKYSGKLIEEKNPAVGAFLGIFPGFGSFYAGEVGYGIINFLT